MLCKETQKSAHLFLFSFLAAAFAVFAIVSRFLPIQRFLAVKWVRRDGDDQSQSETGCQDVDSLGELLDNSAKNKTDKPKDGDD